ncbi:MAG: amidase [Pseudomonadota bacterium]
MQELEDYLDIGIADLHNKLIHSEVTSVRLVEYYLHRIATYDPTLNSIQMASPLALDEARALDAELANSGPRSPLHGVPILVKDNYATVGVKTTAGSLLFAEHRPARDAFQVQRLREAGAVILGKTTMHEFAYGITTVGSNFGATGNAYDASRNPGGSSGGTGAAVAANFAVAGFGSDTCGSIRIPAAQNNLVGLRGTQGLSSRTGIIPLSSTQDIGGPLAHNIADLALLLDATIGVDPEDVQTVRSAADHPRDLHAGLTPTRDARIGILSDWMVQEDGDEDVAAVVRSGLQAMVEAAGWQLQELASPQVNAAVDRPWNGHMVLIYDFKQDIERYLEAHPELGYADLDAILADGRTHAEILPSLQASASMGPDSRASYERELAQREVVRGALLQLLEEHQLDALAYPTIRRIAAPIGAEQMGTNCRLAANSGLPALSVPIGFHADMPVGLELLGRGFDEQRLLNLGLAVETYYPQRRLPDLISE